MKFPEYGGYPQPKVSLLDTYVRHIASFESHACRDLREHLRGVDRRMSMLLGRGCIQLAYGNCEGADGIFRETSRNTSTANRPTGSRSSLLTAHRIAGMLLHRHSPSVVARQRRALHLDIVNTLDEAQRLSKQGNDKGDIKRIWGKITELTAVGVLTRLGAHPWMLAVPALLHHDDELVKRRPKRSYDVSLIETGPCQQDNTWHGLQVKLGCIRVCGEPNASNTFRRSRYSTDILFVSGHCDLGMRVGPGLTMDNPVGDLLISEAEERATPEEVMRLDSVTGSLLLNLTAFPDERRGTGRARE